MMIRNVVFSVSGVNSGCTVNVLMMPRNVKYYVSSGHYGPRLEPLFIT